jgi:hypothetical protein
MLSVIVASGNDGRPLPGLMAALTSAAVEGLVREVVIAGGGPADLLAVLREETGAELAPDLAAAIGRSRSDLLLILAAGFRPRPRWLEALGRHLRAGGREALLQGEGGGFLRPAASGLIVARGRAAALAHPDQKRLRALVGPAAPRLR